MHYDCMCIIFSCVVYNEAPHLYSVWGDGSKHSCKVWAIKTEMLDSANTTKYSACIFWNYFYLKASKHMLNPKTSEALWNLLKQGSSCENGLQNNIFHRSGDEWSWMNDLLYRITLLNTKLNLESRSSAAVLWFIVTWAVLQMHKTFSRNALLFSSYSLRERERERERDEGEALSRLKAVNRLKHWHNWEPKQICPFISQQDSNGGLRKPERTNPFPSLLLNPPSPFFSWTDKQTLFYPRVIFF